jgi:putative ABC transport system permease protein
MEIHEEETPVSQTSSTNLSGRRGEIEKQIVLPWSKAVEIASRSIRMRLGRSLITMIGVILAIAFMVSVMAGETIIERLVGLNDPDLSYQLQKRGVEIGVGAQADKAFKQQQIWIIVLSLVVALIGIVNAMLMSVTERFREIGTMKCLGALDSFIIRLFLIESTFQSMIGTVAGIILGLVVAVAWKGASYGLGTIGLGQIWPQLLGHCLIAFCVGTLIGVLAAIYPAYTASRMAPVDAMRVDE